jgi:alkylation response protein AidB-like acyl-CoA dehydrogenase
MLVSTNDYCQPGRTWPRLSREIPRDDVDAVADVTSRVDELRDAHPPATTEPHEFLRAQFDFGLARIHYPLGLGGLALPPALQSVVDQRLSTAGASNPMGRNPIGIGMGLPTVLAHGSRPQMERFFRPCFTAEEMWCQLFSEPSAGSDLASLAARAEQDGDWWVVNGQKVWTSMAHLASIGMLLARTRLDAPKHRGITYFLVDMHQPGVEVRPLRQMTGDAEFNEVFLTDVRVPDAHRLGPEGEGWRVAMTTLMNERVVLSGPGSGVSSASGGKRIEVLLEAAREETCCDQVLRDELMQRWIEGKVLRWTNLRARAAASSGSPGPEGSVTKLLGALCNRRLQETAMRVHGPSTMAWAAEDARPASVVRGLLRAQANTIEGGTSNVQRNVIGEKILGLPREPGPPAALPWSDLPRNN